MVDGRIGGDAFQVKKTGDVLRFDLRSFGALSGFDLNPQAPDLELTTGSIFINNLRVIHFSLYIKHV